MRRSITLNASESKYLDVIENLKQKQIDKRVLAYIKKVISNSSGGYCCVSQAVIRKAIGVRKQAVTDACRNIVERGELVRIEVNNKNRKNPKPYYFLPNAELSGNSNKSSISNSGKLQNEALPKIDEAGRIEAENINLEPNFLEVGSWNNLDRLSLIEKYLDAGLIITPLIERGKIPLRNWTKEKLRTTTRNEMLEHFRQNPQANVGCWMPKNFVVVDADNLDKFYRLTSGETWETLTATSGREEGGLHFWFRHGGAVGSGNGIRPNLDFKADNCLVVLPPSVHKSGGVYRWNNLVAPADAPDLLRELYDTRENLKNVDGIAEIKTARRGSFPQLSADTILTETKRYDTLFPLGRRLRFRLQADELTAELHRLNRLCCRPPLNEKRMRKLINDVLFGADRLDFVARNSTIGATSRPESTGDNF